MTLPHIAERCCCCCRLNPNNPIMQSEELLAKLAPN
jgi:hypothetical protein